MLKRAMTSSILEQGHRGDQVTHLLMAEVHRWGLDKVYDYRHVV